MLIDCQIRWIDSYFPLSRGVARVDDGRIISGIIFVIMNGLWRRDAPANYGSPKPSTKAPSPGAGLPCSTESSRPLGQGRQARPVDDRRAPPEGAQDSSQSDRKRVFPYVLDA